MYQNHFKISVFMHPLHVRKESYASKIHILSLEYILGK